MRKSVITSCLLALLAVALPAQDAKYSDYVAKLTKAIEFNDEKTIDRLVRDNPDITLRHFNALCWDWKISQKDGPRQVLDAMLAAWDRTFKSRTLQIYERYISARSNSDRELIYKLEVSEREVWDIYGEAQRNKDAATYDAASQGAANLANKYLEVGHAYNASRLWGLCADIRRHKPEPTLDDRKAAIAAVESFQEARRRWDWIEDSYYKIWANWLKSEKASLGEAEAKREKREAEGYDPNSAGADALVMPGVEEVVAELEYAVQKKPHADMFWRGGSVPPLWAWVTVPLNGTKDFVWFTRRPLWLKRPANAKFALSLEDAPDAKTVPVEPSAKFKPTKFFLDDAKKYPYAMWFWVGGEQQPAMGQSHNMAPHPDYGARVFYRSACEWSATINGETVTFFDDNANGKLFEENPYELGHIDYTSGNPSEALKMPAYDAMRIGKKGTIQPFSQFAKIGDGWFHLRAAGDGDKVGVRPLNPEYFKTGKVKMKWKGGRGIQPEVLVIEGEGEYATARYNIGPGKEIEAPVGKYRITFGRIVSGKIGRAMQAQVTAGDMEPIVVEADKTTTVELGAPFKLDFTRKDEGDEVVIDSLTMVVRGRAGEIYTRLNGAPLTPEVVVAKSKTGKGAKEVGEFTLMDVDALNAIAAKNSNVGFEAGFFPIPKGARDTTVLRVKKPFDGALFGLRQKKHKLFKKLDPIMR